MRQVRLWKSATGVARTLDGNRIIRFGLKGLADLSGILMGGRALFIEVKTGDAVQSDDQIKFMTMALKYGAVYILARSVEDALKGVARALAGL